MTLLTTAELQSIYERAGTSAAARKVVDHIRSSEPSRLVQGRAGNVIVKYTSDKTGLTHQAESHRVEYPYMQQFEADHSVREYYDQPPPIFLTYKSEKGRKVTVKYTSDYFVIRDKPVAGKFFGWNECKTEPDLELLAIKMPNRYMRDDTGKWRCPPGEAYASKFGFFFEVLSSGDLNWIWQRNYEFLEDYLTSKYPPVRDDLRKRILEIVANTLGITIHDLLAQLPIHDAGPIYQMIALGNLYVDINRFLLFDTRHTFVFRDEPTAKACENIIEAAALEPVASDHTVMRQPGEVITYNGINWQIINVGRDVTALLSQDDNKALIELPNINFEGLIKAGKIIGAEGPRRSKPLREAINALLLEAGPDELAEANKRQTIVLQKKSGINPQGCFVTDQTVRNWVKAYDAAEETYGPGYGYIGLLSRKNTAATETAN